MKKKIIAAGAASAVLAAMPVVGVFATVSGGPFTDTLVVNLLSTCSIARGNKGTASSNHANGVLPSGSASPEVVGTWGDGSGNPAPAAGAVGHVDTLAGTIVAGVAYSDFGSSNFTVKCNNVEGWQVTAAPTSLMNGLYAKTGDAWTLADDSKTENTGRYIAVGTPADGGTSAWSYTPSSLETTNDNMDISTPNQSTVAASKASATNKTTGDAGQTFKVQYAVSANYSNEEGTYTGTIVYTLAELQPAQQGNG